MKELSRNTCRFLHKRRNFRGKEACGVTLLFVLVPCVFAVTLNAIREFVMFKKRCNYSADPAALLFASVLPDCT